MIVPEDATAEGNLWLSSSTPDGGGIHVRIGVVEDRLVVTDLYVHGPHVTAAVLKSVPISQLETDMNLLPANVHALRAALRSKDTSGQAKEPSLAELRKLAGAAPGNLRFPIEQMEEPTAGTRTRLRRPDGSDPDGFYAQVARAYREYATHSRSPAVEISKEAGVPVGTVHGWIREARRRGHLPPGRKGRAG